VIDSESSRYFLSVVIPAYDEEMRLRTSLPVLRDYLRNQEFSWHDLVSSAFSLYLAWLCSSLLSPVKSLKLTKLSTEVEHFITRQTLRSETLNCSIT
jgi:hypothetical protein